MSYGPDSIPAAINIPCAIENIEAGIKEMDLKAAIFDAVCSVLDNFDGKPCTKRIGTALQAILPGFSVHYGTDANMGWFRVSVWNADSMPYGSRMEMTIARKSMPGLRNADTDDGCIHAADFRENGGYSNCRKHADTYRAALVGFAKRAERANKALGEAREAMAALGPVHGLYGRS